MNSYERVIASLERRQPDRVPYVESVIDLKLMQALLPGHDYYQFNEWLGMDSVGQNRSSWSRDNVQYVDREKGLVRDKRGALRAFSPESTPAPVGGPIKGPEAPDVLGNLPEIVAKYKGKKLITALGRDASFSLALLRGTKQPLIDMIETSRLVHGLIEVTLAHDLRAMQRIVQAGVEVIIFGDYYADKNSALMSPRHLTEFILLSLARGVKAAHEAGAYVIKHKAYRRQHPAPPGRRRGDGDRRPEPHRAGHGKGDRLSLAAAVGSVGRGPQPMRQARVIRFVRNFQPAVRQAALRQADPSGRQHRLRASVLPGVRDPGADGHAPDDAESPCRVAAPASPARTASTFRSGPRTSRP
jgi:hypothetical protein